MSGCNGDGGENGEPDCTEAVNPCETSGARQCRADKRAIELCGADENGCLVWRVETPCAADQECRDGGGAPVCGCMDGCEADATRCSGTIIQGCEAGGDGCLDWADSVDCADVHLGCDDSSGRAECVEDCTDDCDTEEATRCSGNIVQVCMTGGDTCLHWTDDENCEESEEVCGEDEEGAQCFVVCDDECAEAGDTRCGEEVTTLIQACTADGDGCLQWADGPDCDDAGELCDMVEGSAQCVPICEDACDTLGETRCHETAVTVIQTCVVGSLGCSEWGDTMDCADHGLPCDDTVEPAFCPTGGGDSCDDVMVLYELPFETSGDDFTADFSDQLALTDASCFTREDWQVEAVFAVDLAAGDEVVVRETGGIDVIMSLQSACGNDGVCLVSDDFGTGDDPLRYTAEADGRVFIIVEAKFHPPFSGDYAISIGITDPEICNDGIDNDIDELTDCDDDDCAGSAWCNPYRGTWEGFGAGDETDLGGHAVVFTPDAENDDLYAWERIDGVTAFPDEPGGAPVTAELALDNSESVEHAFSVASPFTFFGESYSAMFVGSNGFVTFGAGDATADPGIDDFFSLPRIAGFDADLDPDSGAAGTVTVDEYGDRVVATFEQVPADGGDELVDFQITMNLDAHSESPGAVTITWVDVQIAQEGMAGISSGTGDGTFPSESDFVPPPPPPYPVINEVVYTNVEGAADTMEFVEIYAPGREDMIGYALVHYAGADGSVAWEIDLSAVSVADDGFVVIGDAAVANLDLDWAAADAMGDAAESIVLYTGWDGDTGTVVDAMGYGDSGANFKGEGTHAPVIPGHNARNVVSLGRWPDGRDSDSNAADFSLSWWHTPGEANTPAQPAGFERISGSAVDTASEYPVAIPDNSPAGVDLVMTVDPLWDTFPDTVGNILVGVKVRHGWIGDLEVSLTSPTGTTVLLHGNTGGSTDDIETIYDFLTAPDDDTLNMNSFNGETTEGDWTLNVADAYFTIQGQVDEWVLWIASP
ncbi:MAG: proprotein convertase P-domain-containing protein [Pseudomonadota bacterium]